VHGEEQGAEVPDQAAGLSDPDPEPRDGARDRNLDRELADLLRDARERLGADYAAIGILDRRRHSLERFIIAGLDDRTREAIGALPRGRGVLGALIVDPRPLRLDDVVTDPRSYGFPPGHPEMHSFLGVPILVDGEACGNLYFAKERPGAFDEGDERTAIDLAARVATIVEASGVGRADPPQ
jgi:two-component system, NarL family, sensor histidine kinase DevS